MLPPQNLTRPVWQTVGVLLDFLDENDDISGCSPSSSTETSLPRSWTWSPSPLIGRPSYLLHILKFRLCDIIFLAWKLTSIVNYLTNRTWLTRCWPMPFNIFGRLWTLWSWQRTSNVICAVVETRARPKLAAVSNLFVIDFHFLLGQFVFPAVKSEEQNFDEVLPSTHDFISTMINSLPP